MTIVKVTQEHIDYGLEGHCHACPVALAVGDIVKPGVGVSVYTYHIFLTMPGFASCMVKIPRKGTSFILNFDKRIEVEPIELDLEIPKEHLK